MTWQPPEPAIPASLLMPEKGGLYGPCYTLDQLLAVRREALEQCAELCELFDATHPHGLAAEFRKMKELT
jgi:hypothetical protein